MCVTPKLLNQQQQPHQVDNDDSSTTNDDNRRIDLELVIANRENTAKVGWFIGEHKEKVNTAAATTTNTNHENDASYCLDDVDIPADIMKAVNHSSSLQGSFKNLKQSSSRGSFKAIRKSIRNSLKGMKIPFYSTVREGANFDEADWKDQPCVRQAVISWRDDLTVSWLERHMEMTQGFICVGNTAPGLLVLGEPTHDRNDLNNTQKALPDLTRLKAYIVPPGCGIIIKKGVWHDFPVSCGPPLTVFVINTEEVIEALQSMEAPGPMNHGDCFKLSMKEEFPNTTIAFPDPRGFFNVAAAGAEKNHPHPPAQVSNALKKQDGDELGSSPLLATNGPQGYGCAMVRSEVKPSWGIDKESGAAAVYVVPVINVEVFLPGKGGPAIQPHLQSKPELANKGWRDSGNRNGLRRLKAIFEDLGIPVTAVVNSDALKQDPNIVSVLEDARDTANWELAGHGKNNSEGFAGLPVEEEERIVQGCLHEFDTTFQKKPTSWLTPGFSVTPNTPNVLASNGITALLDFVDDEVPYQITSQETGSQTICIPYSMETNDFSLVLGRHLPPKDYAGAIESHIEQLSDEAKRDGLPKVVCVGMHTFVAGQAGYARELGKAMKRLQEYSSEHVRFTTAESIVNAIHNQ